jgi:hypothetical protein
MEILILQMLFKLILVFFLIIVAISVSLFFIK